LRAPAAALGSQHIDQTRRLVGRQLAVEDDPLEAIEHLVPWESFRAAIEAVVLTPDELKKSRS
jgi:hypothetical protein